MRKSLVFCLALLAADAAAAQSTGANHTVDFDCGNGERIAVSFEGEVAYLADPKGDTYRLARRPAGSGVDYEGSGYRLRGTDAEIAWSGAALAERTCRAIEGPVRAEGFRLDGTTLVHAQSGMRFPQSVAGFVRDDARSYDRDGGYFAVGYAKPLADGRRAHARITVVHLEGMSALEHYSAIKPGLVSRLPGTRVVEEGALPMAQAKGGVGYRGVLVGTGPAGEERVALITADFGYWSARLRTIAPLAVADEAHRSVQAMIAALDWGPLKAAPAGGGSTGG